MPVVDFKTIEEPSIFLNPERNDLKLILWAGDVSRSLSLSGSQDTDKMTTDVERLPDYDVYLCNGYLPGLHENAVYLDKKESQTGRLSYICVIDVNDEQQMGQFIRIFGSKFAVIDSDYYGNTPTLPFKYYSQLLAPGGKAYHTEGINSLRMPKEEFLNALELFAPVITPELNDRRYWTNEIMEQAMYNNMPPSHVWSSPDLKHPYYDGIRERQTKFLNDQKTRNPQFHYARCNGGVLEAINLTEYWDKLPLEIILSPISSIPNELVVINGFKADFATYLIRRIQAEGLCGEDAVAYLDEIYSNTNAQIYRCQQILKWNAYCNKISKFPLLVPTIGYSIDMRGARAPTRDYGVTISKA